MRSDDVLTVPGAAVQLQLRTALVLEQAPILRWRTTTDLPIGLSSGAYLLTANRILVCHPADGGHGHHVREDIFVFFLAVSLPTSSLTLPSSSVPSCPSVYLRSVRPKRRSTCVLASSSSDDAINLVILREWYLGTRYCVERAPRGSRVE